MCENNVGNACLNTTLDAPLALLYIINLAISLVASVVHFCQAYRHGRAFTYHLLGWTSLGKVTVVVDLTSQRIKVTAPIFLVAFLFANEKFVVVLLGLIYLIQCTHHLLLAGLFSLW